MTRVGAWVCDELVSLVQGLRQLECSRGTESISAVRRALERSEIEELRRRLAHGAQPNALDTRAIWIACIAVDAIARGELVGESGAREACGGAMAPERRECGPITGAK